MKNCELTITQRTDKHVETTTFEFEDYRIAIAVKNLLHNMNFVSIKRQNTEERSDNDN